MVAAEVGLIMFKPSLPLASEGVGNNGKAVVVEEDLAVGMTLDEVPMGTLVISTLSTVPPVWLSGSMGLRPGFLRSIVKPTAGNKSLTNALKETLTPKKKKKKKS